MERIRIEMSSRFICSRDSHETLSMTVSSQNDESQPTRFGGTDRDKRFTFTFSSDSCLLIMFIGFLVGNRHPPSANFYPGQSLH